MAKSALNRSFLTSGLVLLLLVIGAAFAGAEEVTTVNLLTYNQATVEIDATGFTAASSASTPMRDMRRAAEGRSSLYIEGDGARARQGTWLASTFVPDNRGTYTFSVYVYGKAGDQWFLTFEEKRNTGTTVVKEHVGEVFTLKGDGWERIWATATMEEGDSLGVVVRHAVAEPFQIWLDKFQLEMGDKPSEWQPPVTTKNLFTYNQATLEYDTRGHIPATGGGNAPTLERDTSVAWEGEASLKVTGDGSRVGQGLYTWSVFVPDIGGTYTASVYIKGTPGDQFYLAFEEKGPSGTGVQRTVNGDVFTLTSSDWERHSLTTNMVAGQTLGFLVRHATDTPFEVWLDGFQMEKGREATEWVPPAKPVAAQ